MTDKATYWWQRGSIKNSETTRSIKRQLYWERSVSIWKTKYIFTLVLLPGIYSVWWETGHKKNCPKIDTASLSKKALNKKQPRGLLRKLWVNKGLHMSDCYSEEVRTVILTQTRAWTNLRNMEEIKENIYMIPFEKQLQKATNPFIPLIMGQVLSTMGNGLWPMSRSWE